MFYRKLQFSFEKFIAFIGIILASLGLFTYLTLSSSPKSLANNYGDSIQEVVYLTSFKESDIIPFKNHSKVYLGGIFDQGKLYSLDKDKSSVKLANPHIILEKNLDENHFVLLSGNFVEDSFKISKIEKTARMLDEEEVKKLVELYLKSYQGACVQEYKLKCLEDNKITVSIYSPDMETLKQNINLKHKNSELSLVLDLYKNAEVANKFGEFLIYKDSNNIIQIK